MSIKTLTVALAIGCAMIGVACSQPAAPAQTPAAAPAPTQAPVEQPAAVPASPPPVATPARVFGHFPYAEAPAASLQSGVCSGAGERNRFRADATAALTRMKAAARAAGVTLNPASCFRAVASQRALYNCIGAPNGTGCKAGKRVSEELRATAVAPPEHSEHHTGYAIDFFPGANDIGADGGCASAAACTTSPRFAQSRSGRWLAAHAHEFGFEQSFFAGSTQGVMIEPWHFRFVGSPAAEAIFHPARTQFPSPHPGAAQN